MVAKRKEGNKERIIDKKWNAIFEDFNILREVSSNGFYEIDAKTINKYKEARLMTKFDYLNSLPDIFYENDLSILPITRGKYVIGEFKAYENIDASNKAFTNNRVEIPFPEWIETIDSKYITSESTMLNASLASGMLADFLDEEILIPTVSGRMSSESFNFNIHGSKEFNKKSQIMVKNSQLEIDGGYESPNSLAILEAKNNVTSSFLVRQLYYPYRLWGNKIQKNILPIFLQYRNGVYNFSLFEFKEKNNYNSLVLVKRSNYIIGDSKLSVTDIVDLMRKTKFVKEPDTPFPQADSLDKILDMVNAIYESDEGELSIEELTLKNDFVYRQAFYYSTAGIYLGLITREHGGILKLTSLGEKLNVSSTRDKNLMMISAIVCHEPFFVALQNYLSNYSNFNSKSVYQLIKDKNLLSKYSEETKIRRAQTIVSWIRKIVSWTNDY